MTTVRPNLIPNPNLGNPPARQDPVRVDAQRAFFEAALGKANAPAVQTRVPPPQAYAQPMQRMPDPKAEPPQKILRPGSLLDIRV